MNAVLTPSPSAPQPLPCQTAQRRVAVLRLLRERGPMTQKALFLALLDTPQGGSTAGVRHALMTLIRLERVTCLGRDEARKGMPLVYAAVSQ